MKGNLIREFWWVVHAWGRSGGVSDDPETTEAVEKHDLSLPLPDSSADPPGVGMREPWPIFYGATHSLFARTFRAKTAPGQLASQLTVG